MPNPLDSFAPVGGDSLVHSTIANFQSRPSVTFLADGRYVIVFQSLDDEGYNDVRGRVFEADGTPAGPDFPINTTMASEQDLPRVAALADGGFVVVWEDLSSGTSFDVKARVYQADGSAGGEVTIAGSPSGETSPAVAALPGGGFVVIWSDDGDPDGDIRGQICGADASPAGSAFAVNETMAGSQYNANVTVLADGTIVAVWQDSGTGHILIRLFAPTGGAITSERVVDDGMAGTPSLPCIVALAGGGFAIAWVDSIGDGDGSGIRARLFGDGGDPVGVNFVVNTLAAGEQQLPALAALPDGGFVVSWSDGDGASATDDIRAQRFDASGDRVDIEFVVNAHMDGFQTGPALAADPVSGTLVVAWTDITAPGVGGDDDGAVVQRQFTPGGVAPSANRPPAAGDDMLRAIEDLPATYDPGALLANDSDPDGDILRVSAVYGAVNGSVVLNGDGTITFTSGTNFNGIAGFDYEVDDGNGGTATAHARIEVGGAPDPAIIGGTDTGEVAEDGMLIAAGALTISDVDTGESAFQPLAGAAGGYGLFDLMSDGGWNYTLDNNNALVQALNRGDTLTDTITIMSADGTAHDLTIIISGANENSPPMLDHPIPDQHGTEDIAVSCQVPADTFSDPENDALAYAAALASGDPLPCWLSFDPETRTFSGMPPLNFNGTIALRVTASDGSTSASDTFDLIIDPVNDAPAIGGTDTGAVTEDGAGSASGALTISDPDMDQSVFQPVATGTVGDNGYGTFAMSADGGWTYSLDNADPAVQALDSGGTLHDTITVLSADGSSHILDVTINGADEPPPPLPPTVDLDGAQAGVHHAAVFAEGSAGTAIGADIAVTAPSLPITRATVTITDAAAADGLILTGDLPATITVLGEAGGAELVLVGTGTAADWAAALALVRYTTASDNPDAFGTDTARTISVVVSDGLNDSAPAIATLAIAAVNDDPATGNIANGAVTWTEGDASALLDPGGDATVTDVDSVNFAGGSLSLGVLTGGSSQDLIFVAATAEVALSGNEVLVGGIAVGAITGQGGGQPLTISFNPEATLERVQLLLHAIAYTNLGGDNPSGGTRPIAGILTDGDGGSTGFGVNVTVTPVNDAPAVTGLGGDVATHTENHGVVSIDLGRNSVLSDPDSANFAGGTLSVRISANKVASEDRIMLGTGATGFTSGGGNLLYNNVVVGTVSAAMGSPGIDALFTFNANATPAIVQQLLRSIGYDNGNHYDPSTARRTIEYVITDGDGGSTTLHSYVDEAALNDAPITTPGGTATGGEDSAIALTGISIRDDGPAGEQVTVRLGVAHGTLDIRLDVAGGITAAGGQGSNALTLTGTLAQVNATLAAAGGLTYRGAANFTGGDTLTVTAADNTPADPLVLGTAATIAASAGPNSLLGGSLTSNPSMDLVYIAGGQVKVRYSNNDGTFSIEFGYAAGSNPTEAILVDYDGDGDRDIVSVAYATGGASTGTIGVLRKTGSFTFDPYQVIGSLQSPYDLSSADLNGDGRADLVVARRDQGMVSVYLSTGAGTYATRADYNATVGNLSTSSLALGDLDGDGRADLIVTNAGDRTTGDPPGSVAVLLNNGAGAFLAPVDAATGQAIPFDVATADFNGDGKLDIVFTTTGTAKGLTVMLGRGDGSFHPGTFHDTGTTPGGIRIADLNGDGIVDLITATQGTPGHLSVFLGAGNGSFAARTDFAIGNDGESVAVGDLDLDGDLDIITANSSSNSLSAFLNQTNGLGATVTRAINVTPVNDAPVVTTSAGTTSYVESVNAPPGAIFVDTGLTIADPDDTSFVSATVSITGGFQADQDVLFFDGVSATGNIEGSYNSATGVLTLTSAGGIATLAQWQAAMRFVFYSNSSEEPDQATRTISFALNDGEATSAAATHMVSVTARNDSPSGTSATLAIAEDSVTVLTLAHFGFSDVDGDAFSGVSIAAPPIGGALYLDGDGAGGSAPGKLINYPMLLTAASIAQGKISFVPDANLNGAGAASFAFSVVDDGSAGLGQNMDPSPNTLTFDIAPLDDGPTLAATAGNPTFTEGGGAVDLFSAVTASTVETGQEVTGLTLTVTHVANGAAEILSFDGSDVALTDGNSVTTATNGLIVTVSVSGTTATVAFSGASLDAAEVQALIDGLSYRNTSQAPGLQSRAITITQLVDSGSDAAPHSNVSAPGVASTVTIFADNDAPTVSFASGLAAIEQTPLDLKGKIAIDDLDAGSGTMFVTLHIPSGNISVDTGATGVAMGDNNCSFVTFTGTLAQLQALFGPSPGSSITYTPVSNTPGAPAPVTLRVYDFGNSGSDGANVTEILSSIAIVPVNDAPSGADKSVTIFEDQGRTFATADFGFTDVDGHAFAGVVFTTVPPGGTLLHDADGAGGNDPVALAAGAFVSAADIAAGRLAFVPAPNASGAPLTSFTFRVRDDGGTTDNGVDTDPSANGFTVTVTALNDAPTVTGLEGDVATFTEGGGPVLIDVGADSVLADVDSANFTLGKLTVAIGGGVPAEDVLGIRTDAVVTVSGIQIHVNGIFVATMSGGSGGANLVITLNSSEDTAANVQEVLRHITYSNSNADNPTPGQRQLTITLSDGDGTANGGQDTLTATSAVDVVAVNDAPVARDDVFTIDEAALLTGSVFSDTGAGMDADADGPAPSISEVNGSSANIGHEVMLASGALLTLNADGSFSYDTNHVFDRTPTGDSGASNAAAGDSFTYTLEGGNSATVTLAIQGLDSDDTLRGTAGSDTISGGAGDDLYHVENGGDRVIELGLSGDDRVVASASWALTANSEVETVEAAAGTAAINLTGNSLSQTIVGNAGANVLHGAGGADTLIGVGGNDTYYADAAAVRVVEAVGGGTDQLYASVSYALAAGSEVELLSANSHAATGAINLTGNGFGQTLIGNAGDNILHGGGGSDLLIGLGGRDIYYIDVATTQLVEYEGGGNDALYVSLSYVLVNGEVETLSTNNYGATTAISLTGNLYNQTVIGNAGANILNGGGGTDLLIGLGGNDLYYIDVAATQVIEYEGGGSDTVYVSSSYALGGSAEVETLSANDYGATAAINLTGNVYSQVLIGNAGANILHGGGGVDTLIGLGGNDVYYVDVAGTQAYEAAGAGADTIYSSVSLALAAGSEVETLSSNDYGATAAINLTGNGFAQALVGNAGANSLNGGAGADTLHGLGGADMFQFTTALGGGNVDTIADFSVTDDNIQLDDAVFTAIGGPGALNPNAFVTGSAAADADDRIIYNSASGQLFYDADGNGGGAAVQFATLASELTLTASDFTMI